MRRERLWLWGVGSPRRRPVAASARRSSASSAATSSPPRGGPQFAAELRSRAPPVEDEDFFANDSEEPSSRRGSRLSEEREERADARSESSEQDEQRCVLCTAAMRTLVTVERFFCEPARLRFFGEPLVLRVEPGVSKILGRLARLPLVFYREWLRLVSGLWSIDRGSEEPHSVRVVGTLPSPFLGHTLETYRGEYRENAGDDRRVAAGGRLGADPSLPQLGAARGVCADGALVFAATVRGARLGARASVSTSVFASLVGAFENWCGDW